MKMNIEVMIYIYGAICTSMIIFNIIHNMHLKHSEPRMKRRCKKIKKRVDEQLERIKNNQKIQEEHLDFLRRKLIGINNLIAFSRVLDETFEKHPELEEEYLHQLQSVILYLSIQYQKKEDMQCGYFTYFLSRYIAKRQMPIDSLQDILLEYVKKKNLYCRLNALKALYHFANTDHIVEAIKIQDDGMVFVHEKIITEGLLSYKGNHDKLILKLLEQFDLFSVHTQLAILNYIRFQSGNYKKEMYAIMENRKAEKELRLAAIRYFGKYHYEPALEILLSFVQDKDAKMWEFTTVANSSLAIYQGEGVVNVLKEALHSENWYIRYSAAQSLEQHQVDYSDLIDIVAGNDRYAREMMTYRLESRKLHKQGA